MRQSAVLAHGAFGPLDEAITVLILIFLTITYTRVARGLRNSDSEEGEME